MNLIIHVPNYYIIIAICTFHAGIMRNNALNELNGIVYLEKSTNWSRLCEQKKN